MIEADRILLGNAKAGKVSQQIVATHLTNNEQKLLPLSRIEKAIKSDLKSRVRF
jgi:hypothetical protein